MKIKSIPIRAIGATTPAYSSVDRLWQAWLNSATEINALQADRDESDFFYPLLDQAIAQLALPDHTDATFIFGTTKGDMAEQQKWMKTQSPHSAPAFGAAANILAREHRIQGPTFTVSAACASGLAALIEAAMLIQCGDSDSAIAAAADSASTFVRDGFKALKAVSTTCCRPFDVRRDGLQIGSAAAACWLGNAPLARGPAKTSGDDNKRPAAPVQQVHQPRTMVELVGYGMAADATHMTAPDREARGLVSAVRLALDAAGLHAEQIDAMIAHGTGTKFNDAMESAALRQLFGHRPPVTGVKGLIGHTLGASGLVETALACRMLEKQVVPPVSGLEIAEYADINWVIGESRPAKLVHVLKTASGFGGTNAAVILRGLPIAAGTQP